MGSTHKTIYMPDAASFSTPVPPVEEQKQIVDYVFPMISKMDKAISQIEETITKLQEYRTALISAAVTGKIDVREKLD